MLGIVWDVDKLLDSILNKQREESKTEHLLVLLESRTRHLGQKMTDLETALLGTRNEDNPKVEPMQTGTPRRVRNWKDQKAILERKFQPPELKDREQHWRRDAAVASKELGNAG